MLPFALLATAALAAAPPHAVTFQGCLAREGRLEPAAAKALPVRRHLAKLPAADGGYRCAVDLEGWPLKELLAARGPAKKLDDGFDRPLDTWILVTGRGGGKALFSYSEVMLSADGGPLLAPRSRLLLPHHHDPLPALKLDPTRLLGPAERDRLDLRACAGCHAGPKPPRLAPPRGWVLASVQDAFPGRFVEDVARIEVRPAGFPVKADKAAAKGALAEAPQVIGPDGRSWTLDPARFQAGQAAEAQAATFGEGMGFHGHRHWTGRDLGSLLKDLLPAGADPRLCYVLVTALDGYRSVFSGTEVFTPAPGRGILLADRINGEPLGPGSGRYHAVPPADFYVDRDVRMVKEIRLVAPAL